MSSPDVRFGALPTRESFRLAAAAVLLFAILAALYIFSIGLRASRNASITGDEPFYLITTQSLVEDGDLDLRNQYEYETYRSFFDHPDRLWRQAGPLPDGRLLSPHQPGLSVFLVPGFALAGLRGAQIQLLLVGALTFVLAFVFAALETRRFRLSWAVCAVTGLTAPAFVYSTEVYPEIPAAACVAAALLLLRAPAGVACAVGLALVLSMLAWLGLKYVPVGLVIAAFALYRGDGRERTWLLGLGFASAAAYVWWHLATFGALTPYNSNFVYDGASTATVLESHFSFGDRTYRLWGLFIDRRFGIGRWAPLLLAVLPVLPLVWRATANGRLLVALIVAQVLMATFVSITMMGWWFPGRMLIVVFPVFTITLAVAASRAPRPLLVLGAAAAAVSVLFTFLLVRAARSGEVVLAVDPFDMKVPAFQVSGRLFPQYTWWTTETQLLNGAWLVALVATTALVAAWPRLTRGRTWPAQIAGSYPPSLKVGAVSLLRRFTSNADV